MILPDFLFWLITGLLSLYPASKLVKFRDRRKRLNWIELNNKQKVIRGKK